MQAPPLDTHPAVGLLQPDVREDSLKKSPNFRPTNSISLEDPRSPGGPLHNRQLDCSISLGPCDKLILVTHKILLARFPGRQHFSQ